MEDRSQLERAEQRHAERVGERMVMRLLERLAPRQIKLISMILGATVFAVGMFAVSKMWIDERKSQHFHWCRLDALRYRQDEDRERFIKYMAACMLTGGL